MSRLTTRSTDSVNWDHSICKCIFDSGRRIEAQGVSAYIGNTIHHCAVHTSQELHEDLIVGNLQIADIDRDNIFLSLEIVLIWAYSYTCIKAKNLQNNTIGLGDIYVSAIWGYFYQENLMLKALGCYTMPKEQYTGYVIFSVSYMLVRTDSVTAEHRQWGK